MTQGTEEERFQSVQSTGPVFLAEGGDQGGPRPQVRSPLAFHPVFCSSPLPENNQQRVEVHRHAHGGLRSAQGATSPFTKWQNYFTDGCCSQVLSLVDTLCTEWRFFSESKSRESIFMPLLR